MATRWKYAETTVTVGENSVKVRQLSARQRTQFAGYSARGEKPEDLPFLVVELGNAEGLSKEDIEAMPPELMDAAWHRILELTGLRIAEDGTPSATGSDAQPATEGDGGKKDS